MSPDQSSILEALYRTGEYYHEKGDSGNAETQLKQALDLDPSHTPSRLLLAKLLRNNARLDESLSELESAFQADPKVAREPLVETLLAKATRLDEEGDDDRALTTLEQVIEVAPDHPTAPARISDIWRKRAEHAVETDDLDFALEAYTKAEQQDEAERIKELIRQTGLERYADNARAHEENEEWEKACSCYKQLIEDDPGNEKWIQALGNAEIESNIAKCYAEGVEALDHSEWKKASDSFLEVLIVRADYKDASHRLVQAVERSTQPREPAASPNSSTTSPDEGGDTSSPAMAPPNEREDASPPPIDTPDQREGTSNPAIAAPEPLGRLEMTRVLAGATLLSFLAALAVVYFLTVPSGSSTSLPQNMTTEGLSSADGWAVMYEQSLSFVAQERSIPNAPLAVFVLLLTAGLTGWLVCSLQVEHGLGSEQVTDSREVGKELTPMGIVQSSLLGHTVRGKYEPERDDLPPRPETPSSASDTAELKNTPNIGEAQPKNTAAPVTAPVLSSLSDTELKDAALELAEEVRSFGRQWKLMAGEAASYPPPKNDDSVQLYVDLIEKLGGFQEDFDKTYRRKVSETCESIVQRVPQKEQTDSEVGQATEADDVEDAAQRLERLAGLL